MEKIDYLKRFIDNKNKEYIDENFSEKEIIEKNLYNNIDYRFNNIHIKYINDGFYKIHLFSDIDHNSNYDYKFDLLSDHFIENLIIKDSESDDIILNYLSDNFKIDYDDNSDDELSIENKIHRNESIMKSLKKDNIRLNLQLKIENLKKLSDEILSDIKENDLENDFNSNIDYEEINYSIHSMNCNL